MVAESWGLTRIRNAAAILSVGLFLAVGMIMASSASAAPTTVSSCQTLDSPGAYVLSSDLAAVDATCIEITASDVKLNLAGHTMSCSGSGFAGSCQVPEFSPHGVNVVPELTGISVKGPGTIAGFDNGIVITDSDAVVREVTVSGPPCAAGDCGRPVSNGILVLGQSGVNLSRNEVSNYARGGLVVAQCPGGDAPCILNGNTVHDNGGGDVCVGIGLSETTGYTLTRNVLFSNGSPCSVGGRGGIILGDGSTGNLVVHNDSSNNLGRGISIGPDTNGNKVVNNTARGNTMLDLNAFPGTSNTWLDNNRCNTEGGAVPPSVCNPGE